MTAGGEGRDLKGPGMRAVAPSPASRNSQRRLASAGSAKSLMLGASGGTRHARHDELGVPLAVTVDFDSVGHNDNGLAGTVTLRERDSCTQARPGGRGRRPLSVVGDCRRRRRRRRRWWCARARSPLRMGA